MADIFDRVEKNVSGIFTNFGQFQLWSYFYSDQKVRFLFAKRNNMKFRDNWIKTQATFYERLKSFMSRHAQLSPKGNQYESGHYI